MNVGITGHQQMPKAATKHARTRIMELLEALINPRGITSLAAGADQIFVNCLLSMGASFELIVPCAEYEKTFQPKHLHKYRQLAQQADMVATLPFPTNSEEAFLAAGLVMVERSDFVIAVWDGEPARGLGGTGDIVAYANQLHRDVEVVWPAGVRR